MAGVIAPVAVAAPTRVVATISPDTVPAGSRSDSTMPYTLTIRPTSGQVGSFDFRVPSAQPAALGGWKILSAQAGVTLDLAGTLIQGRNVSCTPSSPCTVSYTAQAPCSTRNTTWGLVAKSTGGFTGGSIGIAAGSDLTTPLDGQCQARWVDNRTPAHSAFNEGETSENITSEPFAPEGLPIKVQLFDASGQPTNIQDIVLTLSLSAGPTGATLSQGGIAPEATTDSVGSAEFVGSTSNPITIDTLGEGYRTIATGAGVEGDPSPLHNVYEEGGVCPPVCAVDAHSADGLTTATVSVPGSAPAATATSVESSDPILLAAAFGVGSIACEGYTEITGTVTWLYTGGGTQEVRMIIDRDVLDAMPRPDIGIAHVQACFQPDPGKPPFIDRFGDPVAYPDASLMADCSVSPPITTNCVSARNRLPGGDGEIITLQEDGRRRS